MAIRLSQCTNIAPRLSHRQGVTLVEAIASTVIVGVMLVASLEGLQTVVQSGETQTKEQRGRTLATDLLAEILQMPYEDPGDNGILTYERGPGDYDNSQVMWSPTQTVFGPESDEQDGTRALFDDVDDYNGWAESTATLKDGTHIANADGWTRAVVVNYCNPLSLAHNGMLKIDDRGFKVIQVIVTSADGDRTTVEAFRSHLGSPDFLPSMETTYVSWAGISLQVGDDVAARMTSSTYLLNQPTVIDFGPGG